MRKILFMCLFVPFLMAMPVSGEYYQYKDAQGNLRFSDDTANIPKDTQADITSYESIEKNNYQAPLEFDVSPDSEQNIDNNMLAGTISDGEQLPDIAALEKMLTSLDQTEASLKAEHEQLAAHDPGLKASKLQRDEYAEKVKTMNEKMEDYKQQHQAYNEKVKAYNARISSEEKKADTGNDE